MMHSVFNRFESEQRGIAVASNSMTPSPAPCGVEGARAVQATPAAPAQHGATTAEATTATASVTVAEQAHVTTEAGPTPVIKLVAETRLPTRKGVYRVFGFQDESKKERRDGEIIVVAHGELAGQENVPMRVHDQCYTSEVLGSLKCDCREQLEYAMDYIRENESHCGLIVYLPQEGRGIGLLNKLRAYALQEKGYDTVEANLTLGLPDDCREYYCVPEVLRQLGVRSARLLTNNPRKLRWMEAVGVKVTARIPVLIAPNTHSERYLHVKQQRHGHMMDHLLSRGSSHN